MSTGTRRFATIRSLFWPIGSWVKDTREAVKPAPCAWKGAAIGLLIVAVPLLLITAYSVFLAPPRVVSFLIGSVQFMAIAAIVAALLVGLVALLGRIPAFYGWSLVVTLVLLYVSFFVGTGSVRPIGMVVMMLEVVAIVSLPSAALWVLASGGWKEITGVQRAITALGLVIGLGGLVYGTTWLLDPGQAVDPPPNAAAMAAAQVTPLEMPDPSQAGPYKAQTLFYGSGKDQRRPEYGQLVDLVTGSVDGTPFTSGWSSERVNYWGFGPDALPLNGRVWYPDGEGPFPLVLMVHGDHLMYEFSDPGYDYLGELLASRGFIFVSVDANFLNHAITERLHDENDARGWLLLEHLRFWEMWNGTPGNPFYQKVDMDNIAVMGHSRGGEAASIAAAFNRLPYYPDDATVTFDYNFNIRSVVAIAPVFETYTPRGQHLPLENVNYFVLQGSNDQQILSFMGLNQYERVIFKDGDYWFKAALYIYGANHGQFNTVWGSDEIGPAAWLYDQQAVMPLEEQQQIAEVYITAFLEATLRDESGYIPLFRDHRTAPGWLPDTIYLNQFQDSTTQLVSTYDEDMDAGTTTMPGGVQSGVNLTIWREHAVELIASSVFGPIDTSAVYLGWNTKSSGGIASYTISLPDKGLALDVGRTLVFSLADANEDPKPGPRDTIDLTIEVMDRGGQTARLPLSAFSYVQPQIVNTIMKAPFMNAGGLSPSEPIFQSFEFPLATFVGVNPALDPAHLTTVRFVFDRTPTGVVVLDDLGFRK